MDIALEKIIGAMGGKRERIKKPVQEGSLAWEGNFLGRLNVEFIIGRGLGNCSAYANDRNPGRLQFTFDGPAKSFRD